MRSLSALSLVALLAACGGDADEGGTADPVGEGGAAGSRGGAAGNAGSLAGSVGAAGTSAAGASGATSSGAAGASGGAGAGAGGAPVAGAGGAAAGAGGSGGAGGAAFPHDPILFVHGYGVGEDWWNPTVAWFEKQGYPKTHLRAVTLGDNFGSVIEQAKELAAAVKAAKQELGVAKVDILSHSMGGLTTRYYLKLEGGATEVRDYVSLGGAHHGTSSACVSPIGEGAFQMCPPYSDKTDTLQWTLNGDPKNADVDETPFGVEDGGGVTYNAFWSDGDLILSPNETACLNQAFENDCSDAVNTLFKGVLHSQMNTHEGMLTEARKRLQAHGP